MTVTEEEFERAIDQTWGRFGIDMDALAHAEEFVDGLMHYGVKGMKWGVTKKDRSREVTVSQEPGKRVKTTGGYGKAASADAKAAAKTKQVAKASSVDALTNKQLKQLNERMNLEQNFSKLAANDAQLRKSAGRKKVEELLGIQGKNIEQQLNQAAARKSQALGAQLMADLTELKRGN